MHEQEQEQNVNSNWKKNEMPWLMIKNRFKTLIHTYAIYFTIRIFVFGLLFLSRWKKKKKRVT